MTPSLFLMIVSGVSLINVTLNRDLTSGLCFAVSLLSFVVCGILVPLKEVAKKQDLDSVFNALGKVDNDSKKEFEEIKKVIGELGSQLKGTSTKVSKMEMGLKQINFI